MKTALYLLLFTLVLFTSVEAQAQQLSPQEIERTISYQGTLTSKTGIPSDGTSVTMTISLYTDAQGTNRIWQGIYSPVIEHGTYSVQLGSGAYALPSNSQLDHNLWLGVQINGDQEMRPLSQLSPTPYSLNVPNSAISTRKLQDGAVTAAKIGTDYVSSVSVNGKQVTHKGTAVNITTGPGMEVLFDSASSNITFIGSINAKPQSTTGLGAGNISNGTTDIIAGGLNNQITAGPGSPGYANGILGGELNYIDSISNHSAIGGGASNYIQASSDHSFIGGGDSNDIDKSSEYSGIASGDTNVITRHENFSFIGGGQANRIQDDPGTFVASPRSFIGGGMGNVVQAQGSNQATGSVIGGGDSNLAQGYVSVIGGGDSNKTQGSYTVIVGGRINRTNADYSFIGGGKGNIAGDLSDDVFTTISGGDSNRVGEEYGTIGGGKLNSSASRYTFIGGGYLNRIEEENNFASHYSTIGGGDTNYISSQFGTIGGGDANSIQQSSDKSFIGGGDSNQIFSPYATIGGGDSNTISTSSDVSVLAGGYKNQISSSIRSAIGGGDSNLISSTSEYSTIPGGFDNQVISARGGVIGGGKFNIENGDSTPVICGGSNNSISGGSDWSTVAGGENNYIQNHTQMGAILGGGQNFIENYSEAGVIGGGSGNSIDSDTWSFIGGGFENNITGNAYGTGGIGGNVVSGGIQNSMYTNVGYDMIGGGNVNTITNGSSNTIAAGVANTISNGNSNAIGGGTSGIIDTSNYSTISGGLSNRIRTSKASITIGGGHNNSATSEAGTIPGGDSLIVQAFAQTAIGYRNLAQGTFVNGNVHTWSPTNTIADDRIFIVGNGDGGRHPVRSNAFEVSYDGHSIVYDQLTNTSKDNLRAPYYGATYQDNTLIAWGDIPIGPLVGPYASNADFGVKQILHPHTGVYVVTLKSVQPDGMTVQNLGYASITVTLREIQTNVDDTTGLSCGAVTATQIGTYMGQANSFIVRTFGSPTGGGCNLVDWPFFFKVCARPEVDLP